MENKISYYFKDIEFAAKHMSRAAALEAVAEEAAEVAQAALKLARILRGENPTPVTAAEAELSMFEELSDLYTRCIAAGCRAEKKLVYEKARRWRDRAMEKMRKAGFDDKEIESFELRAKQNKEETDLKFREILKLRVALIKLGIPFWFGPCWNGWQIRFLHGADVIEHKGSFGNTEDKMESIGFPEDEDGVTGELTVADVLARVMAHPELYCKEAEQWGWDIRKERNHE